MKRFVCYIILGLTVFTAQAQYTYTLQQCLEEGLSNNYSLRIVRNEEQQSKNNATLANAGYLPTIDLSAGYSSTIDNTDNRSREDNSLARERGVFDQTLDAGIDLNWTIFDGFNISTTYKQLKEMERMGETNTRIALEDFIASLTAEYYNYIQQEIRLKNFRYAVSLSKERLRIVEERYHIGNFSRLDYQQATVDFNADSAQYIKQQEMVYTSRINLNELMAAKNINRPIQVTDSIIDLNLKLNFRDLYNSTMASNASLLKANQNTNIVQMDYKKVLSRNYPYVRLNAGYGYTLNRYDINSIKRRNNWGFSGGITVGINLFDGNRRREKRNASLDIRNAQLEREQLELGLLADLNNLWQAYRNNIQLLNLERQNLVSAKENHEIAKERYLLGDLSGIEMREAQKSLLDAEERILSAEYDTKMCEISLLQLSGKITVYLK
ncbi:TolC family protein [uncultured Bacteroides sp.]|jgi:adhesin transport system outer membrane protein|uniref:TolC family protein n=1 Tax=Bacteroides ilei TaxID=1907658 RepID=UPI00280A7FEA|nr:TolC family protein [uncultured Bacteroides sp.]